MNENLQETLLNEIKLLLLPLAAAAESDLGARLLFEVTGWNLHAGSDPETAGRLAELISAYKRLDELIANPPETLADLREALESVKQLFSAVRQIQAQPGPEVQDLEELGRALVKALVIGYLQSWHPAAYDVLSFLTVIRPPGDISLNRIPDLLTDPLEVLSAEYLAPQGLITASDAKAVTDKLFPRLAALLVDLGLPAVYGTRSENGPDLGEAGNQIGAGLLTLFLQPNFEVNSRYGVTLALSPRDLGNLGLVIIPFGEVLPFWDVDVNLTAAATGFAIGPQGLTMLGASEATGASVTASFLNLPGSVMGSMTGTRLEIGQLQISGDVSLQPSDPEYGLLLDMGSSALVISAGEGDGFLKKILPPDGIRVDFDLAIGWSNKKGFHFRGSAGLETNLPVNVSLFGILTVNSIHLTIKTDGSDIRTAVAASIGTQIGPVQALIDRVGLEAIIAFPGDGGNLGIFDLDLHFKPPTGVGLAIDATAVVGGGYLSFDHQKQEYSGILQLEIAEKISVKAIGLLTTRMPDGGKGFSLVAIIFAQGFAPIQLGFGFTLTGIGGLLAINRTFDENVLRAGLKNHTLDSLLFPRDPIRNAPQIISNLNKVFPIARGNHLFGPMLQIAWGTPPLITANLAVVFEFGTRLRLLILAQIAAILPRRENDLIRLQMDAVGILDFDQGTASLDASLHDSRLLKKFVLTGDMAMRLKWEGSPNFALSVGGLHPAFNPPPAFPKLERIAINLSAGDNPRLRCEAYFAITSNTVQFGARAELYASAAGFSIHGDIGFDVLIQFDPFFFLAEFHAQLQLKRGSSNLFKVRLEGSLAGPRPLHIKGKATFEILWWDVSISIDKTLFAGAKPPPPEPIDVLLRLKEALGNPGNWITQLPAGQRQIVTLRPNTASPTDVLLHPLGSLSVKQNVVPLNLDITRFGQATPAGARRFSISLSLGGQSQTPQAINDFFAPAQFFEMSDDEKLSRPSFELMTAGVGIASNDVSFISDPDDWLEVPAIQFETLFVGSEENIPAPSQPQDSRNLYTLNPTLLGKQALFGAAANCVIRRSGRARYRTATLAKYRVAKEGWSIISTGDLTVQPVPGIDGDKSTTYSEAVQALRKLKRENPAQAAGLKILRLSELSEN